MLKQRLILRHCHRSIFQNVLAIKSCRNASLTSAIGRGVRRAGAALKNAETRRLKGGTLGFWELKNQDKVEQARKYELLRSENEQRLRWLRRDTEALSLDEDSPPSRSSQIKLAERFKRATFEQNEDTKEERIKLAKLRAQGVLTDAPTSIPYTEATSEFVYGTFAVLAALTANKRRFHKLYINVEGEDSTSSVTDDDMVAKIVNLAKRHKVQVERVAAKRVRMLDRMAGNRPHNGVILEASPITQIPIKAFEKFEAGDEKVRANLSLISDEDKVAIGIDPKHTSYQFTRQESHRAPLMLWLDKVTDTGNLGAIIRTAFFLGVDGIILPSHGTAPISAVSVKASAGAAEMVKIFSIGNELEFMTLSKLNGWKFFATTAQEDQPSNKRLGKPIEAASIRTRPFPYDVIKESPCVLILGNEGEGLRPFIQKNANHLIAIEATRFAADSSIIDSLNVSVAAALLIDRFVGAKTHVSTSAHQA